MSGKRGGNRKKREDNYLGWRREEMGERKK